MRGGEEEFFWEFSEKKSMGGTAVGSKRQRSVELPRGRFLREREEIFFGRSSICQERAEERGRLF